MLFPLQNEGLFPNFVRKQNGESENFSINPINIFLSDLRFFFVTGNKNLGVPAGWLLIMMNLRVIITCKSYGQIHTRHAVPPLPFPFAFTFSFPLPLTIQSR